LSDKQPEKQKIRIGDDGELEIVEHDEPQDWEESKLKRSASPLQKLSRSQLIPLLVILQTLCIGALCGGVALVALGIVDLGNVRCAVFGGCPTTTSVAREIVVIPTSTITPLPPPDRRVTETTTPLPPPDRRVTESPCGPDALSETRQDSQTKEPKIAFVSDRQMPFGAIYLADIVPVPVCRLVSYPEGIAHASWSPDGKQMAFVSSRGISIAKANGTGQKLIYTESVSDDPVHWSPDGTRLLFVGEHANGGTSINVIGMDGKNLQVLTDGRARDRSPTWNQDGTKIAFDSDRSGIQTIYLMESDGSNVRRLTNGPDYHPDWSPDGKQMAFASDRDGDREIYIADADGSIPLRLTISVGRDDYPRWSPDGRRIAFVSYRNGNNEIYVMGGTGTNQIQLTNHRANDTWPVWVP
jgi:Tol biopolymer transport system component